MKVALRIVLVLSLLALSGCRSDSIDLHYRFAAKSTLRFEMEALGTATWDIGQRGSGSYHATFDVTETIEKVGDSGAVVSVNITPREVEEDGLPAPEAGGFSLRVGPNGEVLEVLEVDGVLATALDPDELSFIGTYRPPLPLDPVSLQDTWRSEQGLKLQEVSRQIETVGELEGLSKDGDGVLARISYRGEGPLNATMMLPQGAAELKGSAGSRARAVLDVNGGFLREASSTTDGDFEVTVLPEDGRAPLTGTLRFDLELDLVKV